MASADPARRSLFARAADEGGWNAWLCSDVNSTLTCMGRVVLQLAVIDIEGVGGREFRPIVERLARERNLLSIVCGNAGDMEEEIWVRQLGSWLYLPGIAEESNVALLCGEARQIAQRLRSAGSPRSSATGGVSTDGDSSAASASTLRN